MTKQFKVDGFVYDGKTSMRREKLNVRMINDKLEKILSIDNGNMQFIILLEPVEKIMIKEAQNECWVQEIEDKHEKDGSGNI